MSQTIRSAIAAVIAAADPTAKVHDYERWTNTPEEYAKLFKEKEHEKAPVHAWILAPQSVEELPFSHESVAQVITWTIRFVRSVEDAKASEKSGFELVAAVQALFRSNPTLNGAVWSTRPVVGRANGQFGLQVERWAFLQLGPVLCHVAECRLSTQVMM